MLKLGIRVYMERIWRMGREKRPPGARGCRKSPVFLAVKVKDTGWVFRESEIENTGSFPRFRGEQNAGAVLYA